MNDFYFIYYAVGPQFVKTVMSGFKFVPKNANVVLMTPTPKLVKDTLNFLNIKFNLIVLDSDELIDDFSRKHEPVIKETDNKLYMEKLTESMKKGIRFSASTHRYILPWLIKNNITKFALLDCDCLINYHGEYERVLDYYKSKASDKNVFFGPIMNWAFDQQNIMFNYKSLFEKENIDFSLVPASEITVFDGWLRGFWFHDTNHIQTYFNLWDGMIKQSHIESINAFYGNDWTVPDEWINGVVSSVMSKQFDIEILDLFLDFHPCGSRICKHIYHPENDFMGLHHQLYTVDYGLKTAANRKEFFEINKDNLIKFYGNQNGIDAHRISEVIYDYSI